VDDLNQKHPSIKVTLEEDKDRAISFLDIKIERSPRGFSTSVFRKACNTGQVVPFHSFTDARYLEAGIRSDTIRAIRYCSAQPSLQNELAHIRRTYCSQGFPPSYVQRVMQRTRSHLSLKARALSAPPNQDPEPNFISIPFTGPIFYAVKRAATKINTRMVSKSSNTIGSQLCSQVKHRLPLLQQSNVVYSIRCECGGRYVGESERELQVRVKEHETGWNDARANKKTKAVGSSAFGAHAACKPDFEGVEVLFREKNHRLRLLTESACIRTFGQRETILVSPNDANINRNSGTLLSDRWLPVIKTAFTVNTE
jgi:hypothetical protein